MSVHFYNFFCAKIVYILRHFCLSTKNAKTNRKFSFIFAIFSCENSSYLAKIHAKFVKFFVENPMLLENNLTNQFQEIWTLISRPFFDKFLRDFEFSLIMYDWRMILIIFMHESAHKNILPKIPIKLEQLTFKALTRDSNKLQEVWIQRKNFFAFILPPG